MLLVACGRKGPPVPAATDGPRVSHQFLAHPDAPEKRIELFWARPTGEGRWPVLVYIHGHQSAPRDGGKFLADRGVLESMAKRGVVAVSLSQPGYGQSDGPPDYCGPFTQRAVLATLAELRTWSFVDPDKIGLYGISRGAVVASLVEAQDPRLAAAVLVVGVYDFEKTYEALVEEGRTRGEARRIAENMAAESGGTPEALRARSPILTADRIRTPTLILNGAQDFRVAVDDIERFRRVLEGNRVPVKAVIYPDLGHALPVEKRNEEITPFLEKHLGLAPAPR